jgi:hypothetical protein
MRSSNGRSVMRARTSTLAALLAVVLLGLALVASGCGSSSSEDGVAALEDSASEDTPTPAAEDGEDEGTSEADRQEAALEWARCMREHGIDVPDPEFDGQGRGAIRVGGPGFNPDSETFRKAQEECGTPFGRGGPPALSEEDRQQLQETMLEFAKCMREHGVDMPDPEFGEGGRGIFRAGPAKGSDGAPSKTFEEAEKACQPILQELRERAVTERAGS